MAKAIQLVKVDKDYRGLLRAFGKMDDVAKTDMKKIASDLAERGANYARGAASRAPYNVRQAIAVADSIKISRSDKAPSFSIGGRAIDCDLYRHRHTRCGGETHLDEVVAKAARIQTRYSARDQRMRDVLSVRQGDISKVYPSMF